MSDVQRRVPLMAIVVSLVSQSVMAGQVPDLFTECPDAGELAADRLEVVLVGRHGFSEADDVSLDWLWF